jgi:hypothetical protein
MKRGGGWGFGRLLSHIFVAFWVEGNWVGYVMSRRELRTNCIALHMTNSICSVDGTERG